MDLQISFIKHRLLYLDNLREQSGKECNGEDRQGNFVDRVSPILRRIHAESQSTSLSTDNWKNVFHLLLNIQTQKINVCFERLKILDKQTTQKSVKRFRDEIAKLRGKIESLKSGGGGGSNGCSGSNGGGISTSVGAAGKSGGNCSGKKSRKEAKR